jgi:hypothetical protein
LTLFRLPRADLRDALRMRHFEAFGGPARIIEVRDGDARQPAVDRFLDAAQVRFFLG